MFVGLSVCRALSASLARIVASPSIVPISPCTTVSLIASSIMPANPSPFIRSLVESSTAFCSPSIARNLVSKSKFDRPHSKIIFLKALSLSSPLRRREAICASLCAKSSAICLTSATAPFRAISRSIWSSFARCIAPGTCDVVSGASSNRAERVFAEGEDIVKLSTIEEGSEGFLKVCAAPSSIRG